MPRSSLVSYTTIPMHELLYFTDSKNIIPKSFHAEPRASIQTAINYPQTYSGCDNCSDIITSHLPDITIIFRLYLECGRMINLSDWYEAFRSIVDTKKLKKDEEIEVRFSRSVEDLKMIGFVKKTGRKVDHVERLTWNR